MKSTPFIFSLLLFIASAVLMTGCNKDSDKTTPPANSPKSATHNALAEGIYNNVKDWSDQAMSGVTLKSILSDTVWMGTCVLATLDTNASMSLLWIMVTEPVTVMLRY